MNNNKYYTEKIYNYLSSVYGKKEEPQFIYNKNFSFPQTFLEFKIINLAFSEEDNFPGQVLYQLSHEFFHYESLTDSNTFDVIDEIFAEGFSFYILNKYNGIAFNFKKYYSKLDLHEEIPNSYIDMNNYSEENRHFHYKYSKKILQILLKDKHKIKDLINFKRKNIKWISEIIKKIKNLEEINE